LVDLLRIETDLVGGSRTNKLLDDGDGGSGHDSLLDFGDRPMRRDPHDGKRLRAIMTVIAFVPADPCAKEICGEKDAISPSNDLSTTKTANRISGGQSKSARCVTPALPRALVRGVVLV
jgi:hypothetical protein